MKRSEFFIGVTSVGGGVGQSIIKALSLAGYKTAGFDSDPLATGLYAAHESYLIPHSKNQSAYITKLLTILKQRHSSVLFPGSDTELAILATNKALFSKNGIRVVVSNPDIIKLCDDKALTNNFLQSLDMPAPVSQLLPDFLTSPQMPFPVLIKPKVGGSRSQNILMIKSAQDLEKTKLIQVKEQHNRVAQEYIEGEEYTCGSVTLQGKCYGVIVMRRLLRDGDTYKCFTIRDQMIEDAIIKVINHLKPEGACNVQLRVRSGKPYIFEINARCSGTTAARALSGFNEPAMIADYYLLHKEPHFSIQEKTILRYWKELEVENKVVEKLKKYGQLIQKSESSL